MYIDCKPKKKNKKRNLILMYMSQDNFADFFIIKKALLNSHLIICFTPSFHPLSYVVFLLKVAFTFEKESNCEFVN